MIDTQTLISFILMIPATAIFFIILLRILSSHEDKKEPEPYPGTDKA